jgi:hypothetical protein
MHAGSRQFRFTLWLAIVAMALSALWPLLANARPGPQPALFEVCTASGIKWISSGVSSDLGNTGSAPDQGVADHLQPHCVLCSFGTDQAPVLVQAASSIPAAEASTGAFPPAALFHPPHPDLRSPAQPRAPPVLS